MKEVEVKFIDKFHDWKFVVDTAKVSGVPERVECVECGGVGAVVFKYDIDGAPEDYEMCHICEGSGNVPITDEMIIEMIVNNDYSSCLEHIIWTFDITMSKLMAPEFLEHRISSHTARSTRYTSNEESGFVTPIWFVRENNNIAVPYMEEHMQEPDVGPLLDKYEDITTYLTEEYKVLRKAGVPRDYARNILPLTTMTRYIWTINTRSLINFLGLRLCPRAYLGMQDMAKQILKICKKEEPMIFNHIDCRGFNLGLCLENEARPANCRHPKIPTKNQMKEYMEAGWGE